MRSNSQSQTIPPFSESDFHCLKLEQQLDYTLYKSALPLIFFAIEQLFD